MKFSFFGAPKIPPTVEKVEESYSVKKLVGFLDEWITLSIGDKSYAGDNTKRDELLKNIVEQILKLPQEEVEEAYRTASLNEIQIQTLAHEIYQQKKNAAQ